MTRDVLVTGSNGQLGRELARTAWPQGWRAVALGRDRLDLGDPAAIATTIAGGHDGRPWAAVINAAAYTAVDKAESDVVAAWTVNALAPAALGAACAAAAQHSRCAVRTAIRRRTGGDNCRYIPGSR